MCVVHPDTTQSPKSISHLTFVQALLDRPWRHPHKIHHGLSPALADGFQVPVFAAEGIAVVRHGATAEVAAAVDVLIQSIGSASQYVTARPTDCP